MLGAGYQTPECFFLYCSLVAQSGLEMWVTFFFWESGDTVGYKCEFNRKHIGCDTKSFACGFVCTAALILVYPVFLSWSPSLPHLWTLFSALCLHAFVVSFHLLLWVRFKRLSGCIWWKHSSSPSNLNIIAPHHPPSSPLLTFTSSPTRLPRHQSCVHRVASHNSIQYQPWSSTSTSSQLLNVIG